ncbi:putative membrane protein [Acinetobacter sp. 272263]|nr:putative membrane protein [Acinetobacter sp. 272263]
MSCIFLWMTHHSTGFSLIPQFMIMTAVTMILIINASTVQSMGI